MVTIKMIIEFYQIKTNMTYETLWGVICGNFLLYNVFFIAILLNNL